METQPRPTVAVFCFALFHLCGLGSGCFQHLVKTTSPREKFTCTCGPILGLGVSLWEQGANWLGLAFPLYTHSPSSLPKWGPDLACRLCLACEQMRTHFWASVLPLRLYIVEKP